MLAGPLRLDNRPARAELVAAFAVGDTSPVEATEPSGARRTAPTTLGVAMDLLREGLAGTLAKDPGAAVAELERAAELYSAARATAASSATRAPAYVRAVSVRTSIGSLLAVGAGTLDGSVKAQGDPW